MCVCERRSDGSDAYIYAHAHARTERCAQSYACIQHSPRLTALLELVVLTNREARAFGATHLVLSECASMLTNHRWDTRGQILVHGSD